ncbi:MAG TPA: hypothetical protein VD903_06635 [Pseudonocardia sp.]|nr:hypothetical protein [Pseudonocardia sp.]
MADRIAPAVLAVLLGVALAGVLLVPCIAVTYRRRGESARDARCSRSRRWCTGSRSSPTS